MRAQTRIFALAFASRFWHPHRLGGSSIVSSRISKGAVWTAEFILWKRNDWLNRTLSLRKDDLIVIGGAGGFIGGSLARYFHNKGFTRIRAADKKPLPEWYQRVPGVECLNLDLSIEKNCRRACEGAVEVYNLAADMGGMGFIERFRVECLRSILINTHMIEAAYRAGARRYFFSSSACAYNTQLQQDPKVPRSQGIRRLPGDGRARLRLGEADVGDVLPGILGRARDEDRHRAIPQRLWPVGHLGRRTRKGAGGHLPESHRGHRHRQPHDQHLGRRHQTRSFMYIDDCVKGIDMIMHCDELIATPDQPRLQRAGLHQRAGVQGGEDRRESSSSANTT